MRISSEQSQNYLKKIKHINYTFQQIREIDKINKKEILYNFIDNKTIIIITSKKYLNPIYKKENEITEKTKSVQSEYVIESNTNNIEFLTNKKNVSTVNMNYITKESYTNFMK